MVLPFFLQVVLSMPILVNFANKYPFLDALLVLLLFSLNHCATGHAEVLLVFAYYKVHIRELGIALIVLLCVVCEVPVLIGVLSRGFNHSGLSVTLACARVWLSHVFV